VGSNTTNLTDPSGLLVGLSTSPGSPFEELSEKEVRAIWAKYLKDHPNIKLPKEDEAYKDILDQIIVGMCYSKKEWTYSTKERIAEDMYHRFATITAAAFLSIRPNVFTEDPKVLLHFDFAKSKYWDEWVEPTKKVKGVTLRKGKENQVRNA